MRISVRLKVPLLSLACLAWLVAIGAGFAELLAYAQAPGRPAAAPAQWPADATLTPPHQRPMLLLFAHPQCPCTIATIGELDRLMTRCHDRLDVTVIFIRPASMPAGWEQTSLWRSAARIPGVTVIADPAGLQSARFGAFTSGDALLYSANGKLLFSGGITASRGHSGDNAGADSIADIVDGRAPAATATPVFGCPIFGPGDLQSDSCKR